MLKLTWEQWHYYTNLHVVARDLQVHEVPPFLQPSSRACWAVWFSTSERNLRYSLSRHPWNNHFHSYGRVFQTFYCESTCSCRICCSSTRLTSCPNRLESISHRNCSNICRSILRFNRMSYQLKDRLIWRDCKLSFLSCWTHNKGEIEALFKDYQGHVLGN